MITTDSGEQYEDQLSMILGIKMPPPKGMEEEDDPDEALTPGAPEADDPINPDLNELAFNAPKGPITGGQKYAQASELVKTDAEMERTEGSGVEAADWLVSKGLQPRLDYDKMPLSENIDDRRKGQNVFHELDHIIGGFPTFLSNLPRVVLEDVLFRSTKYDKDIDTSVKWIKEQKDIEGVYRELDRRESWFQEVERRRALGQDIDDYDGGKIVPKDIQKDYGKLPKQGSIVYSEPKADLGTATDAAPEAVVGQDPPPQFPLRHQIDTFGRGTTNPIAAFLQLIDGHGLSGEQLDRNQAMHSPLYKRFLKEHPEVLDKKIKDLEAGTVEKPVNLSISDRRSLSEDLNSVQIKYNNWKKKNFWKEELTPQERVTESFIDVRNPNSRY